ncbi:uncharacterized protein ALTATR162_LOCUS9972 [Alternaria atra]|uniref:Uncharacterized protein n=1 Tax=Alternaria atra TaxID=119953 RepID=A0A8J2NA67_9PLEO|nr:uncharacterized protein ALTATR162_LOCUS9972 [Alternaria atra]CAG5182061.1 unnamed protein product [Alternaria atra]
MGLLDLPPEIFERIITHYVDARGIRRAWRRRDVCRTFHDHINTEVLGRQPASAYLSRSDSLFVRNILSSFLEYRSFALYGAHDVLPTHTNKIVNIFVSVAGDTSPKQHLVWIRRVSEALVRSYTIPNACKLAYKPNDKDRSNLALSSGQQEAFNIAIIMGEKDVVSAHAAEQGVSMWAKKAAGLNLGHPLELATRRGNLDMVEILLAHAQRSTVIKDMKQQTSTVVKSIGHALQGNEPIALAVLDWYLSNVKRSDAWQRLDWFREACRSGMTRFLTRLIEGVTPFLSDLLRTGFLQIANPDCDRSVRILPRKVQHFDALILCFLDVGLFDRSNINSCERNSSMFGGNPDGLLDVAVRSGILDVIQRVLDAGAHADGILSGAREMSYPLREAVQRKRFDVVKLLVEYDADPHSDLGA